MGIDIDAKLMYGCYYSDLPEDILEEVDEMLDDGDLDYASPWYDAPRNEWIVGVEVNAWEEGHYDLGYQISNIHEEVPEILIRDDIELLMYVTPNVS